VFRESISCTSPPRLAELNRRGHLKRRGRVNLLPPAHPLSPGQAASSDAPSVDSIDDVRPIGKKTGPRRSNDNYSRCGVERHAPAAMTPTASGSEQSSRWPYSVAMPFLTEE